ncbi:hypothetical protein L1987_62123 [Smallanthus sonchifolius]|uniref:Uncharacterized protein n=1 Tax=Smallanthus sonchifolius TaxID=185202 RepID=A0ACB9C9J6_9ASTR|nr:hypothetical protein L1987_62123 [Smallanthus sonchifolius]
MNKGVLLKSNTLFQIPTSLFLHPTKIRHSLSSIQLPQHKLLSFHVKLPSGSPVFSSKSPSQGAINTPGAETFDSEDEFDEEFEEDEDDDEDEDEDEEMIVPLRNMRQWTRNKPRGFGEGKVYDTKLEDKLLEELEQSRVAQLANINNLKNNPIDGNPNSKKENLPKQKDLKVVPNGIRVRLVNLPKKKNIHKDLQAAFKPFTGITNIIPAVTGNEKTRDPVCKGFAFVDFKSEKEANRFVDVVSTQPITFGKVQKQIRCEIMKPSSPNTASVEQSVHRIKSTLPVLTVTMSGNSNPATETPLDPYVEDAAFDMLKIGDDDLVTTDNYNDNNFHNVVQEEHEPAANSEPLKKQKVREKGKKTVAKKKVENTSKLNIPGSASRLKTKEKALLSGVFSKYGGKSSD